LPKNPSSGVRVARGATYVFVQGVVSTLISVAYLLFLVRIPQTRLPPPPNPDMGIYFVLVFVLSLVQVIGTFALRSASTKHIAQYSRKDYWKRLARAQITANVHRNKSCHVYLKSSREGFKGHNFWYECVARALIIMTFTIYRFSITLGFHVGFLATSLSLFSL